MMIPEITVQELANKLKSPDLFILLDVREDWEVEVASIVDSRLVIRPMSRLASEGIQALPEAARRRDAEILVLCHHGIRSADVAGWLLAPGRRKRVLIGGGGERGAGKLQRYRGFLFILTCLLF